MNPSQISRFILSLFLLLTVGCSSTSSNKVPGVNSSTATIPSGTPEPLCPHKSTYQVGLADLNKPISPCNLYFYVHFNGDATQKSFQVTITLNQPFPINGEFSETNQALINQIKPYSYLWTIKNAQGEIERAWLAFFIKNRDGSRFTIVTQPEQDWRNSFLEIYIEDVNADDVREDVTYELAVGDFLSQKAP